MKKTIQEQILEYLFKNRRRWVSKKTLEDRREQFGCMAETVGRKARKLWQTNVNIKKRLDIDGIVEYKYEQS